VNTAGNRSSTVEISDSGIQPQHETRPLDEHPKPLFGGESSEPAGLRDEIGRVGFHACIRPTGAALTASRAP
jgi:hypothetical protein